MSKKKEHLYYARWYTPSLVKMADVSFTATSTESAVEQARVIAKEIGYASTAFTVTYGCAGPAVYSGL